MNDVLIGRQPIFNSNLEVFAYKLLICGSSPKSGTLTDTDPTSGQQQLNGLAKVGVERLAGDRLALVNMDRQVITTDGFLSLDPRRVVLELANDIEPDEPVLAGIQRMASHRYSVAMNDRLVCKRPESLLPFAKIVNVDLRVHDRSKLAKYVQALRQRGAKQLLAERVDTWEDLELCRELGFDLFQGDFLTRPRIKPGKFVPNNGIVALQLLAKLQNPNVGVRELEILVGRDVSLSYKLLLYLNSAAVGLKRKVDSLRQAITLVGRNRLRMIASVIAFTGVCDKPPAIMQTAVVRAKMCELLAEKLSRKDCESFYLVGLFSALDVLTDCPLEDVLRPLSLNDDVRDALLRHEGIIGHAIQCALAAENSDWDPVTFAGLTPTQINQAFLQAISFAIESDAVVGLLRKEPDHGNARTDRQHAGRPNASA